MKLQLMRKITTSLLFIILLSNIIGQKVHILSKGIHSDSSFYCVEKITENEFWIGGESGILKKIDSLGNINTINFPNKGIDILKIKRINNYVFLITSNAVIYRYQIDENIFIEKEFPQFKNKCFYDIMELKNGSVLVCGGASGIAKGRKVVPKGFIATINQDLKNIKVVWKCYRKFVWSLIENKNHKAFGFTFNGLNTRIIQSDNLLKWRSQLKIKGLVHNTILVDNQIWYCGAKNINYSKKGIVGAATDKKNQTSFNETGCLWSLESINSKIISVTQSGELLKIDKNTYEFERINIQNSFTLYDLIKISESKMLIVGHGKTAYIIEFSKNF